MVSPQCDLKAKIQLSKERVYMPHSSSPPQDLTPTLQDQVNTLELKVAYHERLNQDLSDQVYDLHKEVESLRSMISALKEQLQRGTQGQLDIDGPRPQRVPVRRRRR